MSEPQGTQDLELALAMLTELKHDTQSLLRRVEKAEHLARDDEANRAPRITVDVESSEITLDGKAYQVKSDCVYLVDALVKADGDWINGEKINETNYIGRVDRVKLKLPPAIRELIESQPGAGYRIPRSKLIRA